jgi:hypothetical protein
VKSVRKTPTIARPGPWVLGTALIVAFAGCAGPPPAGSLKGGLSAADPRGLTTTSARIDLDDVIPASKRVHDRLIQTILGSAATYELNVYVDNSNTPGATAFSGTGAITGGTQNTITVDNLPASYPLDFKVIVKDGSSVDVGRGLAQATLTSQNAVNSVPMTGYAEGGDLTGQSSGFNSDISVSYSGLGSGDSRTVSARYKLSSGTQYNMSFSETAISCAPTLAIQYGAETAVLPGTGSSDTANFSLTPGSTGYYDFKATFSGCTGNPTYRVRANVN